MGGCEEFAECAIGRTVTATWKCRAERGNMNKCMIFHATQENYDIAREEWFRDRIEKRKLREQEKAKAAAEVKGSPREGEAPAVKRAL
jgi:COX assembly protein 1